MEALQPRAEGLLAKRPPPPDFSKKSFAQMFSTDPQTRLEFPLSVHKGEVAIKIPAAAIDKLSVPFKHALVGKFSHGRPTLEETRKALTKLDFKGALDIGLIDYRHVLLRFHSEADFHRIWTRGIWQIGKFPMRVFKWSPSFQTSKETSIVPVWFELPGLPCHLFDHGVLFSIMKAVGEPLSVDAATLNLSRPSVARVKVEIDLMKELPSRIWIEHGDDGEGFWQKILPENLPLYCTSCFRQGHSHDGCTMNENRAQKNWRPKDVVAVPPKPSLLLDNPDLPNTVVAKAADVTAPPLAAMVVQSDEDGAKAVVSTGQKRTETDGGQEPSNKAADLTLNQVSNPKIIDWDYVFKTISGNIVNCKSDVMDKLASSIRDPQASIAVPLPSTIINVDDILLDESVMNSDCIDPNPTIVSQIPVIEIPHGSNVNDEAIMVIECPSPTTEGPHGSKIIEEKTLMNSATSDQIEGNTRRDQVAVVQPIPGSLSEHNPGMNMDIAAGVGETVEVVQEAVVSGKQKVSTELEGGLSVALSGQQMVSTIEGPHVTKSTEGKQMLVGVCATNDGREKGAVLPSILGVEDRNAELQLAWKNLLLSSQNSPGTNATKEFIDSVPRNEELEPGRSIQRGDRYDGLNNAWQNLVSSNAYGEVVQLEQMGEAFHSGVAPPGCAALEDDKKRKHGMSDRVLRSMLRAYNSDPSRASSL